MTLAKLQSRSAAAAAAAAAALLLALALAAAQPTASPPPAPRSPSLTLTPRNETGSNATEAALAAAAAARAAALPRPATAGGSNASSCPPANFTGVPGLDVRGYIAAPWYVQKQLPLDYQPPDELFCVKAEYELRNPANISDGLLVSNYANRGGVNGPYQGSSKFDRSANSSRLIALPDDTPDASDGKLLVGPEALLNLTLPSGAAAGGAAGLPGGGPPPAGKAPAGSTSGAAAGSPLWRAAFGPYWVVAVGPSQNATLKYDWAIISGGAPMYPGLPDPDTGKPLCTTVPPPGTPANTTSLLFPGARGSAAVGVRERRGAVAALGKAASRPPGRNYDVGGECCTDIERLGGKSSSPGDLTIDCL
ncbi:hypothetical protein CHLRE_17g736700v5 [Chlamydomonas reinhardtii]|uniref:Uncharacterized protein n=1 Tax=Chlamydomonas reinhardtii TaxID=3055 RepID=A0A2K3CRF9_CHLRE|nr:uncharacterized protein CHLRE_17g736700v5 [Chlamydomonas reinhardtii]PNW70865.1 hypothetical protein CHLRE_17g736700v5 [Chlamydomonas reinhardtii]